MQEKKPKSSHSDALDEFWDIERLLPSSATSQRHVPTPPSSTDAVEIDVPAHPKRSNVPDNQPVHTDQPMTTIRQEPRADHGGGAYAVTHGDQPEEPELSYQAQGCLLHTVKIYTWRTNYHYFDQFIKDAEKYAAMVGREARKEPFFSYFPQYAQMGRKQLAWYLWWRDNARQGVYLETDYAYVLLYLFELLNLPAKGERAEHIRDDMAKLWMVYRRAYPQLDHYMCEWLCDYCLIHELSAPIAILMPALGDVISTARLKEFYLSSMIVVGDESVNLASARILLSYCCQYDYRKSKFAAGEHKQLFDTLIPGAIAATFPLIIGDNNGKMAFSMDASYISRDAYVGALCAYSNKRRIEVSYTSFSRSHDLRFLVGDMVRHAENRLRGSIGVRSRLTTHFLDHDMKDALDAWLDVHLPKCSIPQVASKNQPRPAYEALYDSPRTEISLALADEIEKSSWETTRILTEAFEDDTSVENPVPADTPKEETPPMVPQTPITSQGELMDALGDKVNFLRAVMAEDRAAQNAYCQATRQLPDAVVDEINDITTNVEIFDMVIEDVGGMYAVIEDYRLMLTKLLNGDDGYE